MWCLRVCVCVRVLKTCVTTCRQHDLLTILPVVGRNSSPSYLQLISVFCSWDLYAGFLQEPDIAETWLKFKKKKNQHNHSQMWSLHLSIVTILFDLLMHLQLRFVCSAYLLHTKGSVLSLLLSCSSEKTMWGTELKVKRVLIYLFWLWKHLGSLKSNLNVT